MQIGTRILYPEEIEQWDAEIIQISVYSRMEYNLAIMTECADACKKAGKPYVIHPVGYSLLNDNMFRDVKKMAEHSGVALLLHDERTPGGKRLKGEHEWRFKGALDELKRITKVSFENSLNTPDAPWFWNSYADSVTLDIGHMESAGLDSGEFIHSLDEHIIQKTEFVHIHRNNGMHGGITDHWPLTEDCREMSTLHSLLKRKHNVRIILELNEPEHIPESLNILRRLRDSL